MDSKVKTGTPNCSRRSSVPIHIRAPGRRRRCSWEGSAAMTHTQTLSTSIEINDGVPLMSGIRKGCNGFKAEPEFPGACSDASEVFEGLAFEVKVPYYQ